MAGNLQVRVKSAYEAECAEEGGADRIILMGEDGLSPDPDLVRKVRKATTVHLRVLLRLRGGYTNAGRRQNELVHFAEAKVGVEAHGAEYTTDGGEMASLKGLAFSALDAGADGFVFGFLNSLSGIDRLACTELAGDDTWGWTFDRAIDATLDQDRAWKDLRSLPRLDSVMTAGSAREVEQGLDHLISWVHRKPPIIVAGELKPEHIPWLARAGLTTFFVEDTPVTAESVRAWRLLIDEEIARRALPVSS